MEELRQDVRKLREKVYELEDSMSRNLVIRAVDSVTEALRKYELSLVEVSMPIPPHPTPMCILHGKPITWEDPECEICKEGRPDGKIGSSDNYRDSPSRRANT